MDHVWTVTGLVLLSVFPVEVGRAETVVLVGGGRLRGEVVDRPGSAGALFLRTAAGGTIGIPRDQIENLIAASEEEQQYRALRAQAGETLEAHWQLAEWCKEHGLPEYRDVHLRAVLACDPDHEAARRALGYARHGARWMTEEQWKVSRGYVRFGRRWRLPQEVALLKQKDERSGLTGQWYRRIKQWYDEARGRDAQRRAEGWRALAQIEDRSAMEPMEQLLGLNADPGARMLYVDYLARLGTAAAVESLVVHSMADRSAEVRDAALEHLARRYAAAAVPLYVRALGHMERAIVARAASYLAIFDDDAAVVALIDALVTRLPVNPRTGEPSHEALRKLRPSELAVFDISPRDIRDALSGSGAKPSDLPAAFAAAQGLVERDLPNRAVLDALIHLTGQDFGYDEAAWLQWYDRALAAQYRPLLEKP